jgi:hypothetical protein
MTVARLYDLQQVDAALARTIAHRQGLDDGAALQAAVSEAARRLEGVRGQIHADQGRLKALDLEVQSIRARRTRIEADLYSGRIGNPKELQAMQDDVASLARMTSRLEDEELELLERGEQFDAMARDAQREWQDAQAALDRQIAFYHEAAAADDQQIAALEARRAEVAAGIDEDLLRRYDRLRASKGGLAVVAVRGGICDGCHVAIPERVVSRLRNDPDHLAACDACGRLLVIPTTMP